MRRWTTAAVVVLVAITAVVGFGYVWRDHLQGVWGPGDRGGERFDRGGAARPPGGEPPDGVRPPDGSGGFEGRRPDGDREGGGRAGRWFTADGMKGFVEAGLPMVIFGGLVAGADQLLRARRRRLRNA